MSVNQVQPTATEILTKQDLKAPQRYSVNSYAVDKTPKTDTAEFSNKKKENIKKAGIATTVVAAVIGAVYLLRGKKPPKTIIKPDKAKMVMTEDAKKIYDGVANKLGKRTKTTAETIERNLKPKEKVGSWDKADMKKYYTELEENSAKAAKEAEIKAAKEAEIAAKNIEDAKKAQQALQEKVDRSLKEFQTSIEGKSKEELEEMYESLNLQKEYARYSEIGKTNREKLRAEGKATGDWTISDTKFLQGEDKVNFDILIGKADLINNQKVKLVKEHYERLLCRAGDKSVNVPHNCNYLTDEEREAFNIYYDLCPDNDAMRKAKGKYNSKYTRFMDSGFKKAPPLEDEAVVYRAVSPDFLETKEAEAFLNSLEKGNVIKDYAYISTAASVDAQFRQFASNVKPGQGALMRIKLPKGTKGVYGGHLEYLLPRNTELKIVDTQVIDGIKVVEAEYILPKEI